MTVRWVWLFLDLPEEGFEESSAFWCHVARSRRSPWRGERGEFATLLPEHGDPWVKVQRVGGAGGVHLDLDVDVPLQQARETARGLGAEVLAEVADDDGTLGVVVCRSPGGFTFCLTRWRAGEHGEGQVRAGQPSLVDQVCLDIPRSRYAAEADFWSVLTGWPLEPRRDREFQRLTVPAEMPVRFLLQELDEPEGAVRAHVDLAARDRGEEVARHVTLGAVAEGDGRGWTVVRDPRGWRYCVTDRDPLRGAAAAG